MNNILCDHVHAMKAMSRLSFGADNCAVQSVDMCLLEEFLDSVPAAG